MHVSLVVKYMPGVIPKFHSEFLQYPQEILDKFLDKFRAIHYALPMTYICLTYALPMRLCVKIDVVVNDVTSQEYCPLSSASRSMTLRSPEA